MGGKFITGFASGAISSIVSSAWHGGTNLDADGNSIAGTGWRGAGKFADSSAGMITFGTLAGGLGAHLTGGNFWQGAMTGFMVSALNHELHKMRYRNFVKSRFKNGFDPQGKPEATIDYVKNVMHKNVEGLEEDYLDGGSPRFELSDAKSGNNAIYNDSSHVVTLYPDSYTNNYKLAYTLFHEYWHAIDAVNGYTAGIVARFGPVHPGNLSEAYLEYRAYQHEIDRGNMDGLTIGRRNKYWNMIRDSY